MDPVDAAGVSGMDARHFSRGAAGSFFDHITSSSKSGGSRNPDPLHRSHVRSPSQHFEHPRSSQSQETSPHPSQSGQLPSSSFGPFAQSSGSIGQW
jgi:hypothetical protein